MTLHFQYSRLVQTMRIFLFFAALQQRASFKYETQTYTYFPQCGPTWIIDQQFSPHACQLEFSYRAFHQPRADCWGSHFHSPKHSCIHSGNHRHSFLKMSYVNSVYFCGVQCRCLRWGYLERGCRRPCGALFWRER